MKNRIFVIVLLLISFLRLAAHEEPAKTLREKQDKEDKRQKIIKNKISKIIMWKHAIEEGRLNPDKKEKFLESSYNNVGNLMEMKIYKMNDSLDYKVEFTYDENNNMITDTDYNPNGTIYEQIKYAVDKKGRVTEQINFKQDGSIDSKFTYKIDYEKNTLLFEKHKPLDSVEYQMIYKYDGNPDESRNIEIIKQTHDGKLIMRVINKFDTLNKRTQKKIYDESNKLLYYFKYGYNDETGDISTIEKRSPNNELLSKTIYEYNEKNQTSCVQVLNESLLLVSYISYTYN